MYKGSVCGLCGDLNGEQHLEFLGPEMNLYDRADQFAASYLIPSKSCRKDDIENTYGLKKVHRNAKCEIYRNMIRSRFNNGKEETCFSIMPVKVCGEPRCTPARGATTTKMLDFTCLPAHNEETYRLVEEAEMRELTELSSARRDLQAEYMLPERCVPTY